MTHSILDAALALVCWTLVIWVVMYLRRIPAMQKAGIKPQQAAMKGSLDVLPATARAAADNYNHLHEQPTLFYALVFYSYLSGHADILLYWLAWAYVAARVVHSVIQVTVNIVVMRFTIFAVGSIILMIMAALNVMKLMAVG